MPKFQKIIRDEDFVRFVYQTGGKLASEELQHTFHEAPMESFDKALQALAPVAANFLELGKEYAEGLLVKSLAISYTKHGTRSATIVFRKQLDIVDAMHQMETPSVQIDEAAGGEESRRECTKKQAEQIYEVITEAEKYLAGERQQRILPLMDAPEEPQDGDAIRFDPKAANG